MEITDVEAIPVNIPRKSEYETALGTLQGNYACIVKIHTDEGIVGLGETSISLPSLHNTIETIAFVIENKLKPLLVGENPLNIEQILEKIDDISKCTGEFTYVKAGIDIALYDLFGKYTDLPVYQLLGGKVRDEIPVSRSIGKVENPAERAVEVAEEFGYHLITVKTGFDPKDDIERVAKIREAVGPDFPIEVDANQGWDIGEAIRTLRTLEEEYGVLNCEQPTVWWDDDGLARVNRNVGMDIIADEPIRNPFDVARLAKLEACDQVTLKIFKQGGFQNTLKIVDTASAHNMECNSGSLFPTGVGTSAIHQLCASRSNITMVGYGSPLERCTDDIINEEIDFQNGRVVPFDEPGLGVSLNEDKVEQYRMDIDW